MNTQEAFAHLLSNKELRANAGISTKQAGDYRYKLKLGKLSLENIETVLNKAGFKIMQETKWITPEDWRMAIKEHAAKSNWPL